MSPRGPAPTSNSVYGRSVAPVMWIGKARSLASAVGQLQRGVDHLMRSTQRPMIPPAVGHTRNAAPLGRLVMP